MSIVLIEADARQGGSQVFRNAAEATLWAQQQRDVVYQRFSRTLNSDPNGGMSAVLQAWNGLITELTHHDNADHGDEYVIIATNALIMEGSPIFKALMWIENCLKSGATNAAAVAAGLLEGQVNWAEPSIANAVILFHFRLDEELNKISHGTASSLSEKIVNVESQFKNLLSKVDEVDEKSTSSLDSAKHLIAHFEDNLADVRSSIAKVDNLASHGLSNTIDRLSQMEEDISGEFSRIQAHTKAQTENWLTGFQEQRRLEKPITLWEDRASKHETAAKTRKLWMIGIGIAGLPLGCLLSMLSFEAAAWLFNGVVSPSIGQNSVRLSAIRPTFQYELLFASAVTLAYLTMYLWAMRLLVRLYTIEHHLAIDANGRSALTETYLSLRGEGQATDSDRAIMLSVIFRPVIDGMVKEDGPPAISPAAFISGIATASNR